ncbi:unnamed protein product, partial [Meganyctiphanes norvegica]
MPPKKKEGPPEPKPLIGRVGTNLKVGIVGLPNVGKSTFFNVLTKSQAQAENFPFCTIDPNESRVPVPDSRWDFLCEFHKPASKVPAFLNVTDIAGLVKGAAEGQGLGNAFLSHIKACDALFHMSRAFEDDDVTHVEGDVNPIRDMEIIMDELRLKDIEYVEGVHSKLAKMVERGEKKHAHEFATLTKVKNLLEEEKRHIRFSDWDGKEIEVLNQHLFITSKPVCYLVNLSEKDFLRRKNKWLTKVNVKLDKDKSEAAYTRYPGTYVKATMDIDPLELPVAKGSGIYRFRAKSGFEFVILDYKYKQLHSFIYLILAFIFQKGTKAPQAAGKIHTDFEKGFVMADVMKFEDFKEEGSEAACKAGGKYHQRGRNYVVEDGDIIFFKFNTGGLKKK